MAGYVNTFKHNQTNERVMWSMGGAFNIIIITYHYHGNHMSKNYVSKAIYHKYMFPWYHPMLHNVSFAKLISSAYCWKGKEEKIEALWYSWKDKWRTGKWSYEKYLYFNERISIGCINIVCFHFTRNSAPRMHC